MTLLAAARIVDRRFRLWRRPGPTGWYLASGMVPTALGETR